MRPSAVTWLDSSRFTYALGFLMLSMGLTLTVDDFRKVNIRYLHRIPFLRQSCTINSHMHEVHVNVNACHLMLQCLATPAPIAVGYFGQYFIKPLLGFLIAKVIDGSTPRTTPRTNHIQMLLLRGNLHREHLPVGDMRCCCWQVLNLSPALATGLILVSCCPGGQVSTMHPQILNLPASCALENTQTRLLAGPKLTSATSLLCQASNVATYIAHGDVALSVLMTTASTVGAIVMTPLLVKVLAGALVPVDAKVHSDRQGVNESMCFALVCCPAYRTQSSALSVLAGQEHSFHVLWTFGAKPDADKCSCARRGWRCPHSRWCWCPPLRA